MSSMMSTGGGARHRRPFLSMSTSDFEGLDAEELLKLVDSLSLDLQYTVLENGLIERYLDKNDPELLLGVTVLMAKPRTPTRIQFAQSSLTLNSSQGNNALSMRSKRCDTTDTLSVVTRQSNFSQSFRSTNSLGFNTRVNYVMRCEMCEQDFIVFSSDIDNIRSTTKDKLRQIIAKVEEARLSKEEAKATLNEFHTFMFRSQPVDLKKVVVHLERFIKFIEKTQKNGLALIETMRLRDYTMRKQIMQKQQALAIKAELSGILRPIDFEELGVQKQSLQLELDKKNSGISGLKKTAAEVSRTLAEHRKNLEELQVSHVSIYSKINQCEIETERLKQLGKEIVDEIFDWHDRIDSLEQRMKTTVTPSTTSYMESKQLLRSLNAECCILQRKRSTAATKLVISRKKVRNLKNQLLAEEEKRKMDKIEFEKILKQMM